MSRYRFQQQQRNPAPVLANNGPSQSTQYHRSRTVPLSFNIPTRKQINALFEKRPEDNPVALLTPKPSQASNDPRYQYLLNSGTGGNHPGDRERGSRDDRRKRSGSRSSSATSGSSGTASTSSSVGGARSNPSPSSTGYTSAISLALDDDEVKKMFGDADEGGCPNAPASPLTLSSSSLRSSTSSRSYGSTPNTTPPESVAGPSSLPSSKARFDLWMLNPGAAAYAAAFSGDVVDTEEDEVADDEDHGELDMCIERQEDDNDATPRAQHQFDKETTDGPLLTYRRCKTVWQGQVDAAAGGDLPLNAHVLPPPRPQATAAPRHLRKPWHPLFEAGCRFSAGAASVGVPAGAECSRTYATRLLETRDTEGWDDDSLEDLVQAFVWKATLDDDRGQDKIGLMRLEGVAAFASKVREALQALDCKLSKPKDEQLETMFVEKIRSMVMGTFVSCWHVHPDNRYAIAYDIASPNRTPRHLSHIKYSLRLCSFIGDLYQERLLSRLDTIGCVRILLFNVSMVEHLTGIENILKRAGPKLWKEATLSSSSSESSAPDSSDSCDPPSEPCWSNLDWEVREFESQLWSARERVQDNQFLLRDNEDDKVEGGVRRKVDGLITYVWESCRFLREGYAGDGRYVAVGSWQPSNTVAHRHPSFC